MSGHTIKKIAILIGLMSAVASVFFGWDNYYLDCSLLVIIISVFICLYFDLFDLF